MKGILLVNHFLTQNKFSQLHSHLVKSAEKCGVDLVIKTNLQLACESAEADFVLFWDKDVNLARRLEKSGLPVFNSAQSIALCDDKAKTYTELLCLSRKLLRRRFRILKAIMRLLLKRR